jgi:hypothetical protein
MREYDMANKPTTDSAGSTGRETTFKLFATKGRVLAQNIDGKLIDIGSIESDAAQKHFVAQLDVDGIESTAASGEQFALEDVAGKLSFDYLDSLFTSEEAAEFHGKLQDCPHIQFSLDEPLPRGLTDYTPPHLF